jgi:hypothetical protein
MKNTSLYLTRWISKQIVYVIFRVEQMKTRKIILVNQ